MIFTVFAFLLPPIAFLKGLRHWFYAIHIALLTTISWWKFPSLEYPFWHDYYLLFLGGWHLALITLITFVAYGWDKRQAKRGGWRVPEKTLHSLSFMGGSFGAFIGSKIFRHKTIKGNFKQMFIAVVILQLMLVGVLAWVSHF